MQKTSFDIQTNQRLCSIQILRIISCVGVFAVHFGQRVNLSGPLRTITDFGRYGVELFFIISGYLASKGLDGKPKNVLNYYKKRAIQILPLYGLIILWYFITENILDIYLHHIPEDAAGLGWFRYIFLLNGFVNSDTYFWSNLGITWTIPIFAFFYLIIPWIERVDKNSRCSIIIFLLVKGLSWLFCTRLYACTIFENIWIFFVGVLTYHLRKDGKSYFAAIIYQLISIAAIIFEHKLYAFVFLFASIFIIALIVIIWISFQIE